MAAQFVNGVDEEDAKFLGRNLRRNDRGKPCPGLGDDFADFVELGFGGGDVGFVGERLGGIGLNLPKLLALGLEIGIDLAVFLLVGVKVVSASAQHEEGEEAADGEDEITFKPKH